MWKIGPNTLGWECPVCGRGNAPLTATCPCIPVKKNTKPDDGDGKQLLTED